MQTVNSELVIERVDHRGFDEARLAAVAFLARYNGRSLDAYRQDLRGFFGWAGTIGLEVLAAPVAEDRPDARWRIGADLDVGALGAAEIAVRERQLLEISGLSAAFAGQNRTAPLSMRSCDYVRRELSGVGDRRVIVVVDRVVFTRVPWSVLVELHFARC